MTTFDFSLANPKIKAFFEAKEELQVPTPVAELLYVHTHPLIRQNFISDIELIILETANYVEKKKLSGKPIEKLSRLTQKLGELVVALDKSNAEEMLNTLRSVKNLCEKITGKK